MSWNDAVIEQFRAGADPIAERFSQEGLLLLHTVGARSGEPRVSPVARFDDGERVLVGATYAGRPEHPAWYHNLAANPAVSVELWRDGELVTYPAVATSLEGAERDAAWAQLVGKMPGFADYEAKTDRVIPVVALTPA